MNDISLHRVSDPAFVAVDMAVETAQGPRLRRLVCASSVTPDDLDAQWAAEQAQLRQVLHGFAVEAAWRAKAAPADKPLRVTCAARADARVEASAPRRRRDEGAMRVLVQVVADARGVDDEMLAWWLDDEPVSTLYLVAPPASTGHLPTTLARAQGAVALRVFDWVRAPEHGRFDPLALAIWYELAGLDMALREAITVGVPQTAEFIKRRLSRRGDAE
jgi:hypothetical protein